MNVCKVIPYAVAAAIVLAACSTPAAAPTTASTTAAATQAPAATTAPEPTATTASAVPNPPKTVDDVDKIDLTGKKVEVLFWHKYSGAQISGVVDIVNDFNTKNPYGITVKLEKAGAGYPDVYNKINAVIQGGGTLPALSIAYQNQASLYRGQGAVIDLTPFIQSTKYGLSADDIKDFFPLFLQSDKNPQFPGEVLGWPTNRSMDMLYTNLDWLKQLGYSAPPTTLKDFEEMACKASDKANGKFGYIWRGDASDFASLVFANGGNILKPDASGYDFNSPAAVEALSLLQRLFKNGCAVQLPSTEANGDQTRFAASNVLFDINTSSGLPFMASAVDAGGKFKWTMSMLPQADATKIKTNLYGASWSVYKTTPEQELGAWLFMKFFTLPENTAKWAVASNYMAVRQSAAQTAIDAVKSSSRFKNYPEAADGYASMYQLLQYGAVESPVAGYDPVRALIMDMVVAVAVKGEGDPKAALDTAVSKANDLLKEYAPK